ncbi:MAG TPA: o-succinylbenzoate--CoA ligase [Chloroflexota bacterium]|nr:o-succinylbenzoate--CoA ligase [Chloroflexota bacterium]
MNATGYAYGGQVPDWLAARAALAPHHPALVCGGERITFAELDRRANAVARRLAGRGIAPGGRVAVLLRNGTAMAELVHGAGRAGAVLVPLNTRLAPSEIAWQVADSRARLLIHDGATRGLVASMPAPVNAEVVDITIFNEGPEASASLREHIDLAAVHTIVYTSGTTGRPKGALLTYGNHWWSAVGSALNLGLHADDSWLAVLPLFHVGGLSILMRGAIYGMAVHIHEAFDPAAVNSAIDEGVTIVSAVATMLRRMLDQREGRPYPRTLRHVLLGGGPAPLPLLEECARLAVPVVQTYGLTETASQAATLAPADALRKLGSAGRPLLPTELRIERDGMPVRAGEPGEIVVRGPTVTPGYADRPEETAAALRDGWLHTGDLGYLDDEGYLYVLDRRGDLIISGGENVYPAEVEAVLLSHPAVADAGVAAQADERWGQVPVAYVVLSPGTPCTVEELLAYCRARLAGYKVPARCIVVPALPRNAAGKLMRQRLSELAAP